VLRSDLTIDNLYTFHYFELSRNFYSTGEKHDFWEFIYVDKGEMHIYTDFGEYRLTQGEVFFYKPNLFHRGGANSREATNLIILSFDSRSPCMTFFENKRFRLDESDRLILAEMVKEGMEAFDPSIKWFIPYLTGSEDSPFGCEQLIKNYLEIFLIRLIRKGNESGDNQEVHKPSSAIRENTEADLSQSIIRFMEENIAANLTLDELCKMFSIGKTQLKTLFKKKTGRSCLDFWKHLKIERAKTLIREESHNITEIAERLGYSTVHYFSTDFKKATDMTPTDYARTVQARLTSSRKSN
jgi:AraC-like DNA-binding protein